MRQRQMSHIPLAKLSDYAPPAMTTTLGLSANTASAVVEIVYAPGITYCYPAPKHWPNCAKCGQSCQGSYAGKPTCTRCSSTRRLNG